MLKMKNEKPNQELIEIKGLTQDEVKNILESSVVKDVIAGDIILREGEGNQSVYLILQGKINLVKKEAGILKKISILGEGDWFGIYSPAHRTGASYTAVASSPSKILSIDYEQFAGLDINVKLQYFMNSHLLSLSHINKIEANNKNLTVKAAKLTQELFNQKLKNRSDYRSLEMIRKVIQKIPKLPVFATTLLNQILNENVGLNDIADQVKSDPSLAVEVLKTINSPYYGLPREISDIHSAVVMLGADELYQIVMSAGIKRTMPDTPKFKELHAHCVIISYIAATLSSETRIGNSGEMSTIGLLHDLGQTVLQLLKEQNPKVKMLINTFDSSQLGSLLLKSWEMPEVVWKTVDFQFFPEFSVVKTIPDNVQNKVLLIYLSHLCYDFLRGVTEDSLPTIFFNENMRYLDLQKYSVSQITEKILLPAMKKKINSYPVHLKMLIKKHV